MAKPIMTLKKTRMRAERNGLMTETSRPGNGIRKYEFMDPLTGEIHDSYGVYAANQFLDGFEYAKRYLEEREARKPPKHLKHMSI